MFNHKILKLISLSLKKKNKIVWDENHKKWVNLDEDGTETSSELKPPPKMAEMVPQNPNGQPGIQEQHAFIPYQHATNLSTQFYPQTQQNFNHVPGQAPYPANPAPLGNPTGIAQPTQMSEDVAKPTQPNMFKLQRGRSQ